MSMDLVPCVDGRPAVITVRGATVYLGIRDAEVQRQERAFTKQLFMAHPDRGGSTAAVRKAIEARAVFRRRVAREYAALGVPPLVPVGRELLQQCACGRWFVPNAPIGRTNAKAPATFCASYCQARRRVLQAGRHRPRRIVCDACGKESTTRIVGITTCGACRRAAVVVPDAVTL
jgi:hypothetical protein